MTSLSYSTNRRAGYLVTRSGRDRHEATVSANVEWKHQILMNSRRWLEHRYKYSSTITFGGVTKQDFRPRFASSRNIAEKAEYEQRLRCFSSALYYAVVALSG